MSDLPYLWAAKGRGGRPYWFYRRDGQLVPIATRHGQRFAPGDVGFIEAYERVHATFSREPRSNPQIGTLAHAIDEYRTDADYKQLAPKVQSGYGYILERLKTEHGSRLLSDFPRDAVLKIRKERMATPAVANTTMKVLRLLLNYVEDHLVTFVLPQDWRNPMRRPVKRLKQGDGHFPWEEEEIEQFRERWVEGTLERALFETYLNTGQRGEDVRLLKRKAYRNGALDVAQTKTGEAVWIPVLDDLKPIIDAWLSAHPETEYCFSPSHGGPYSRGHLSRVMHNAIQSVGLQVPKAQKRIERDDRTPHGLRYTFAIRAIELGMDHDTIEAIVGHKTLLMAVKYTEKRRKARLLADTLNAGLKRQRERRKPQRSGKR